MKEEIYFHSVWVQSEGIEGNTGQFNKNLPFHFLTMNKS